jgi:signal transduction histidine kinase/CheY-like chemotaxis protein
VSIRQPEGGALRRRLFRQVALLTTAILLCSGALEAYFGHQQSREQVLQIQSVQAQAASAEIEQYLQSIDRVVRPVQALPWGQVGFDETARRAELHRLLSLVPALTDLMDVSASGEQERRVSRALLDEGMRPAAPAAGGTMQEGYSVPFMSEQGTPQVRWITRRAGNPQGFTQATLNLQFLNDLVSGLRLTDGGMVAVVHDGFGLIAHPDATLSLRQPSVAAPLLLDHLRQAFANREAPAVVYEGVGLLGHSAIATATRLPSTGWMVVVEHPSQVAMAPVFATLWRTASLVLLAALAAMLASAAFASRVAEPVAQLRSATARMAKGDLDQTIRLQTGDEIQGLAEDFNAMSARLQQSYGELEQKVEQRTAELALRRDEAERANAAKTRFLASASHDLRQPMHAIGLLVGVLRERLHDPGLQGLADKTHQAVQSMEGLFGSLLDVSKLDAGAVQPQSRPFALQDLLHRVANAYAPLAEAKSLRLRARPSRLVVHTDPALLERMVGNLVTNAIRYTTQGGVLVACRRRRSGWVLQVIDSGCGIAADHLDLIFEEFVRLDGAHARDQGLGLGLAIVRRTAGLLGLAISVRSRPGHGSVFELSLPVVDAVPTPVAGPGLPGELQRQVQGAFVLVVDDDARNLEATAGLFQQWGCLVATAANASAALDELGRHLRPPDVVVTDFRLGAGLHGLDLIRQVRAHAGQWVPALLVTAETQLPQTLDGDTQLLQKPVGPERLLQALARSLAGTDRA